MRRFTITLLAVLTSSLLVGWVIKETKSDEPITFIASPSGTPAAVASIQPDSTMRVDALSAKSGVGSPRMLKTYFSGTSYTNGTPTITSAQGGWTITSTGGRLIPYQTTDGQWYLRFTVRATYDPATISTLTMTISGVSFSNDQSAYCYIGSPTNVTANKGCAPLSGTGNVSIVVTSTGNTTGFYGSGDVAIASKPTWAD